MESTVVKLGKHEEEGKIYIMGNFLEVICLNSEIYHNFILYLNLIGSIGNANTIILNLLYVLL